MTSSNLDRFHEEFWHDLDGSQLKPVEDYVRNYPDCAAEIEKAYEHAKTGRESTPPALAPTTPADDQPATPEPPRPERIGPYRILDVLGEGGMGTVYLAEQKEPVRRRVALKLIRLGMASDNVLRRFEAERQALAMMNHDNIAKIYEAGLTEQGQPYFVMEHAPGLPLTEHCDKHRLSTKERLELFQQVCSGVQHAHQKGVIHRDLKPSNVLVTVQQGRAVPKIIDFGLARATDHRLVTATIYTEQGRVLGTPEYMSPEQAEMSSQDIDTRTDVYSLGVMLYELLVGALPFTREELRKAGLLEIQRKIREDDPPKPSTRLTSVGTNPEQVAKLRRTTPARLHRALRSDLDWVVMRAMEKDRNRRYSTAVALEEDLGRYLGSEPVMAGPPSAGYRIRKFVRRYRVQVASGLAVSLTVVAGAIGMTVFGLEAKAKEVLVQEHLTRFNRLAVAVRLEEAEKEQKALYPAWPEKIEALEGWLENHGRPLKADLPQIRQTLQQLEAIAFPQTQAEKQKDCENHPRYNDYLAQQKKVAALQRAMEVRQDKARAAAMAVDAAWPKDASALNERAWLVVDPDRKADAYGQEALGLALIQRALALAPADDAERHMYLDTLAWALFANGRFEEAGEASRQALEAAPEKERREFQGYVEKLQTAIRDCAATLSKARDELSTLSSEVNRRQGFRFADKADGFLHATLRRVEKDLLAFLAEKGSLSDVEGRLSWAKKIEELTLRHPNAQVTWEQARRAILKADGVEASKLYADPPIELSPQTGLVPIGMNPVTKLWEFYHLRSACDPRKETAAEDLVIPEHGQDGSLEMAGRGIVLVLIPGARFRMGAQKTDDGAPNHDPADDPDEVPVHEVTLGPFLLSRYEMTQGQWARLTGGDYPSFYKLGVRLPGRPVPIGDSHPVEQVSWEHCEELMGHYGLALPTEAQWEYGCRAGTSTPWFPGREPTTLAGHANILDEYAVETYPTWGRGEAFRDGYAGPAPVGTYKPNGFGLHDVHGNVWEWCRDWYGRYTLAVRADDGLRGTGLSSGNRVYRGGSFMNLARYARCANRNLIAPAFCLNALGVRPAREITR